MQWLAGVADNAAAASVVLPAPGSPEITILLRCWTRAHKNAAAGGVMASRATSSSSVTSRTVYRRTVADKQSATGGIAAVSRAVPSRTRACTIGCFAFSWRSVTASNRSRICRFSSSAVGSARPRSRPLLSRYVTRAPSMKISSTSVRASRSVSGPRSVMDRRTRRTIVSASPSGTSSPRRAWR